MKPITTLALFPTLALARALNRATCYIHGPTVWAPDVQRANIIVNEICNAEGMAGTFTSMQTKYHCSALDTPGKKAEFEVQWKGKGTMTLDDKDCNLRLSNEINGCQYGGDNVVANWYFRSDPNDGTC